MAGFCEKTSIFVVKNIFEDMDTVNKEKAILCK